MLHDFIGTIRFNKHYCYWYYGEIISGSDDNSIKIWDGKDFKLLKTLDENNGGHSNSVSSLAISNNGIIASGSFDKSIKVWNQDFTLLKTLNEHSLPVLALVFNLDGCLISGSSDKTIKVWS
jgi:WD40 repeat protein